MLLPIATWLTNAVIFIIFIFILLYLYTSRRFNYWKKRGIPYKTPAPFFGNFGDVFKQKRGVGPVLRDIHFEITAPYSGIFILDSPGLYIKDPDLQKLVLIKDFQYFSDRNVAADNAHDTLGSQMLFLIKSPEWNIYRKKMTPAYTGGKIKSMFPLFEDAGQGLVQYISKTVEKDNIMNCKDINMRYAAEVITSTSFGLKANCFEDDNSGFRLVTTRLFNFNYLSRAIATTCYMVAPSLVSLLRLRFIDDESASFLRFAFWKTIEEREKSQICRNDFIDILIEMRKNERLQQNFEFDGDRMLAQAAVFFMAGFETTSSTMTFALYELARHPEVQNKLRAEIQHVINTHGKATYDLLNNSEDLKYLDMVFKETVRMYPVVPYVDRLCNKDYTIPGTTDVIEKGIGVYVSLLGIHMDPDNFPNPEQFIPERFTEENAKSIKPFTYLPFGEGPRNCIGARFGTISAKSAIFNMVANFEIEMCDSTPKEMVFHSGGFLLQPAKGNLNLRFKKIQDN